MQELVDEFGRVMRDLRVSVTDRCNFRCMYCLPETEAAANFYRGRFAGSGVGHGVPIRHQWKPKQEILSFDEIVRIVRVAVDMGVDKIRLTGGEPLLRRDFPKLVEGIAAIPGVKDLAVTTNGFLFPPMACSLKDAGLNRVSFSLDSLDGDRFRTITGMDGLDRLLESIDVARSLDLGPVKVNAVIIRDVNDGEIVELVRFAKERGVVMRFIEFMPLDSRHEWQRDLVVSGREILERIRESFDLVPLDATHAAETAKRWGFADGSGEVGVVAPVTDPFCGKCNRIRLTSDGKIRTCLFSLNEHDVKAVMRSGGSDEDVRDFLARTVWKKEAGHRIGREDFVQPERSMSCIGG